MTGGKVGEESNTLPSFLWLEHLIGSLTGDVSMPNVISVAVKGFDTFSNQSQCVLCQRLTPLLAGGGSGLSGHARVRSKVAHYRPLDLRWNTCALYRRPN